MRRWEGKCRSLGPPSPPPRRPPRSPCGRFGLWRGGHAVGPLDSSNAPVCRPCQAPSPSGGDKLAAASTVRPGAASQHNPNPAQARQGVGQGGWWRRSAAPAPRLPSVPTPLPPLAKQQAPRRLSGSAVAPVAFFWCATQGRCSTTPPTPAVAAAAAAATLRRQRQRRVSRAVPLASAWRPFQREARPRARRRQQSAAAQAGGLDAGPDPPTRPCCIPPDCQANGGGWG